MVAEVHRHEAGKLQEPRINAPPRARIDHRALSRSRSARTKLNGRCVASVLTAVGASRVSIGPPISVSVFGRAALRSAAISAVAARGRYRGLADGEHVRPLAGCRDDRLAKADQIIDVIVQVEGSVGKRHQLGVSPVGDVTRPASAASARPFHAAASHNDPTSGRRSAAAAGRRRQFSRKCLSWPNGRRSATSSTTSTAFRPTLTLSKAEFGFSARGGRVREDVEARRHERPHLRIADRIGGMIKPVRAPFPPCGWRRREMIAALHRRRKAFTVLAWSPRSEGCAPKKTGGQGPCRICVSQLHMPLTSIHSRCD